MPSRKLAKQSNSKATSEQTTSSSEAPQQHQAITPSTSRFQFLRNFLRRLILLGFAAAATYISLALKEDPYEAFVKSGEEVTRRSFQVACSGSYGKEFPECIPRRCGRVVMDGLLAADDVERLISMAKLGFGLARSDSGYSTLDLHTGIVRSLSGTSSNIYKLPKARDIFTKRDFAALARVRSTIQLRITLEFGSSPNRVFPTRPLTITRIMPEAAALAREEYWRPRVAREAHRAWYYSATVDLGTYGEDFSGGRFVLVDNEANRTVEPRKGRMSLLTSGSENLRYIEKVKTGERYFLTVAFTCDPNSATLDPSLQNLMTES